MLWQEDRQEKPLQVPTDVIDLLFEIEGREIPVDHAHSLSQSLYQALPWLSEESQIGIHSIHVAASQNGWERPDGVSGQRLHLSRRTKLCLRLPSERLTEAQQLIGQTLDIDGCQLKIGKSKTRPLSSLGTVFARYVAAPEIQDEADFWNWAAAELKSLDIQAQKALCGLVSQLETPQGTIQTRSLLLAELNPMESVRLQRFGLGPHRHLGCGLFIPHKGIAPVKSDSD